MAGSQLHDCECADTGCPVHPGLHCGRRTRTQTLTRVDMEDRHGTRFCPECAADALDSGLFR